MPTSPNKRKVAPKERVRSVYEIVGGPDAEEMQIKAQLVMRIGDCIKARGLTQQQAAKIMGLTQAKVSQMLRGQFRGISQAKLLEGLAALGNNVEIRVKSTGRQSAAGKVAVVFAA